MKKREPISTGSEWTFELIQRYDEEIARVDKLLTKNTPFSDSER